MKKVLLAAAGLSGLLASCGIDAGYSPVNLTAVNSFVSQYYYVDTQGVTRYVICNDRPTTVTVNLSWTGPLSQVGLKFTGATTGTTMTKYTPAFGPDTSGNGSTSYTFQTGTAPQSLPGGVKAQAIIPVPVNPKATFVDVWGYNPDGVQSNVIQVPQGIEVAASCG